MTIAITIKINDGVVLASDSATTFFQNNPATGSSSIINVYENANKILNLYKELPIGVVTWGAGSIGKESIATLIKDFRKLINEDDTLKIDKNNYTIEEVARKFSNFFYDNYRVAFETWNNKPYLGFFIAGYSSGSKLPDIWNVELGNNDNTVTVDRLSDIDVTGTMSWRGQPEPISRLVLGCSNNMETYITESNLMTTENVEILAKQIRGKSEISIVEPAMPIKDAIDLADFLVDMTIKYYKFTRGSQIVGGPIEIAAITKHEGFKWIKRKHYFNREYNL